MSPHHSPRRRMLAALSSAMLATAFVVTLTGCGTPAQPALSPGLGIADQVLRAADPALPVTLAVLPPQVAIGQPIALRIGTSQPGYLYVYQVGSAGQAPTLVFPNAMDGANYLQGDTTQRLPRGEWRMTSRGPAGLGYFIAVVSREPQDLMHISGDVAQGRIAITGSYGAAMATLREVAP